MRLTRQGIVDVHDRDAEAGNAPQRPGDASTLLQYWHRTLDEIDGDCTFGDLIALLRGVEDIDVVAPLVGCNIAAFLEEADQPTARTEWRERMWFVQVSNVADPQTYVPDPSQPDEPLEWLDPDESVEEDHVERGLTELTGEKAPLRLIDATGDDPITGEPQLLRMRGGRTYGKWSAPYSIRREFGGWGKLPEPYDGYFRAHPDSDPDHFEGAFALDLTPVAELLDLPLRYDPTLRFNSDLLRGTEGLLFETQVTITFGELLHAIFWEIGFFGEPEERASALDTINERHAAIERIERDAGDGRA